MKSFNSAQPGGPEKVVEWQPEDFGVPSNALPEGRVQDLIALLQLDQARTGQPKESALRRAEEASEKNCVAWAPAELVWSSPFAAQDWMELDNLSALQSELNHQQAAAGFHSAPPEEILNAEKEAEEILARARQEASEIVQQAQQLLEETQQQALAALEQVRAEDYKEGWANAESEAASILKAAQEMINQYTAWRDDMFAKSEPMLVEMVKQIGRSMFGDGLILDPKALEINLNRVVENAKSLGDLKIYLNPFDAEHLDPAWREYQQMISGNRVQIVPSDGITRGGCFVQGQMGTVDARVETQMKAVLEVFNLDDAGEGA